MRVTFDSNTLDKAVRPGRFPKDPRQPDLLKVNAALSARTIEGFFCDTIVTLEGIQNKDRVEVLGSTTLRSSRSDRINASGQHAVHLNLHAEQTKRQPLHSEVINRLTAALALGFHAIGAPRIGGVRIDDPAGTIYLSQPDEAILSARLDKFMDAARAIEARGVGAAQVAALAETFAKRAGVTEPWLQSLQRAQDIREERSVQRAVAEWADGDSLAAHIGYGIDLFCTEDEGNSAGGSTVLDKTNRAWLSATYGVRFVTLTELAAMV
jgi:hypothetical protein